jgi:hypothetical protein
MCVELKQMVQWAKNMQWIKETELILCINTEHHYNFVQIFVHCTPVKEAQNRNSFVSDTCSSHSKS